MSRPADEAMSGAAHAGLNPAKREKLGTAPDMGLAETRRLLALFKKAPV